MASSKLQFPVRQVTNKTTIMVSAVAIIRQEIPFTRLRKCDSVLNFDKGSNALLPKTRDLVNSPYCIVKADSFPG